MAHDPLANLMHKVPYKKMQKGIYILYMYIVMYTYK